MRLQLVALVMLALVAACGSTRPKVAEPAKASPSSTVSVSLPVPICQAPATPPAKPAAASSRNAAAWKAYALKLEQLLGISPAEDKQ
jgi:hypothetical protein